ncbi:histidine phosphatase family protein [Thiomicrospira sp. WB1]|uniref:histidine phosphatase family protein n=1 Tax=Thiomicrospira sp. WB1 TaxID=1685380 RepID=UPI000AFA372E|nr:histidine phosphatase family protein [Thiomicrospira sp. WB1]
MRVWQKYGLYGVLGWLLVVMSTPLKADDEATFWQALQEGGKVVLVRHAAIDREFGDPLTLDDSCFTERNLNAVGREQAQWIGQAFRQRQIEVRAVLASPHCRTRDTAEIAFGGYEVAPMLRVIRALPESQAKARLAQTRERIASFSGPGNLVMVTHRPNIGELIYHRLEPGDMAVLAPMGMEEGEPMFDLIATFSVSTLNQ